MNDFEYIFNGMKTQNLTLIKEKFQLIFQQSNYSIYDAILDANSNSTVFSSVGILDKTHFIQAVNNTNHDIYKFLNILL